jgi:DNA-binding response OmpR family regulator
VKECSEKIAIGELELNTTKCSVSLHGNTLDLRRREYQILELLAKQRGKILNVEQIIEQLWTSDVSVDPEVVRCHINLLRHKLADRKDVITTVYGKGYKIEP